MGPVEPPLHRSRRGRRVWAKAARVGGGSARVGGPALWSPPRAPGEEGQDGLGAGVSWKGPQDVTAALRKGSVTGTQTFLGEPAD